MTHDDYLRLARSCYDAHIINNQKYKFLISARVRKYCEEHDVVIPELDDIGINKLLTGISFGMSTRTIELYVNSLELFFDYLIANELYKGSNPLASAINTTMSIKKSVEGSVPFYYLKDVKAILNIDLFNNAYYRALLLTFFEGVAKNAIELKCLKKNDVDFGSNTIMTARGELKISKELCEAYKEVATMDSIYDVSGRSNSGLRRTLLVKEDRSVLLPTTRKSYYAGIIRRFILISDRIGQRLETDILYYDGFIEHVIDAIGLEGFLEFMNSERAYKNEIQILTKLHDKYKYAVPVIKMKTAFRPYIANLMK